MKTLLTLTHGEHHLAYFIDGYHVQKLDSILPIYKLLFEALLKDFCGDSLTIYNK
jgi:hypothetical protein